MSFPTEARTPALNADGTWTELILLSYPPEYWRARVVPFTVGETMAEARMHHRVYKRFLLEFQVPLETKVPQPGPGGVRGLASAYYYVETTWQPRTGPFKGDLWEKAVQQVGRESAPWIFSYFGNLRRPEKLPY